MMLGDEQVAALRILTEECAARGISFALIGASVLAVYLKTSQLPSPEPRRTRDLDAVLPSSSWEEYEDLRRALLDRGFRAIGDQPEHRLFYHDAEIGLLPCGEGIVRDGRLVWPQAELDMSVLGFAEALEFAEPVEVAPGLRVPVAPLWLVAHLKAAAFIERRHDADIKDLVWILSHYEEQQDATSRRFDVHEEGIDYERSGAYLIGKDVADSLPADKRKPMYDFLDMFDAETGERAYPSPEAERLFIALRTGLDSAAASAMS